MRHALGIVIIASVAQVSAAPTSDADQLKALVQQRQELEHRADTEGLRPKEVDSLNDVKLKIGNLLRLPSSFGARDYDYLVAWGQNLWLDRKFSEAESTLQKAVLLKPDRIAAMWYLANLVQVQRRSEESLSQLKRLVQLKPQDEAEQSFRVMAAHQLFVRGDFDPQAKLKFVQDWLLQNPESPEAIRALGEAALDTNNVAALIEARKKEKNATTGLWIQAHLSFLQGRYAESLSIAQQFYAATTQADFYAKAYYKLVANDYQKLNKAEQAYQFLLTMPSTLKSDADLQRLFEDIVTQNSHWGVAQLQTAAGFYPKSLRLQVQALDTLMRNSSIELVDFDPVVFRVAQAFAERLMSEKFAMVDAHYWRGYMAFQQKDFRASDQEFLHCLNFVRDGLRPVGRGLELGRVFATAAHSKLEQHYTAEAAEIVNRGLALVRDRKNKELLQQLKDQIEKQAL